MNQPTSKERRLIELLARIVDGGGFQQGTGLDRNVTIGMTAATECYWGTSGRGAWQAVHNIELAASIGLLEITKSGSRNRKVRLTDLGWDLLHTYSHTLNDYTNEYRTGGSVLAEIAS